MAPLLQTTRWHGTRMGTWKTEVAPSAWAAGQGGPGAPDEALSSDLGLPRGPTHVDLGLSTTPRPLGVSTGAGEGVGAIPEGNVRHPPANPCAPRFGRGDLVSFGGRVTKCTYKI